MFVHTIEFAYLGKDGTLNPVYVGELANGKSRPHWTRFIPGVGKRWGDIASIPATVHDPLIARAMLLHGKAKEDADEYADGLYEEMIEYSNSITPKYKAKRWYQYPKQWALDAQRGIMSSINYYGVRLGSWYREHIKR
jgi:hypothetical protein